MHEAMVAQSLLATISAETAKQIAKPISAKISCGMLYAINDETLCFAFQAIAGGTPCEGMKLKIEHKPMQALCNNCSEVFDLEFSALSCPNCSSNDCQLLPDQPLILEEIEFQSE